MEKLWQMRFLSSQKENGFLDQFLQPWMGRDIALADVKKVRVQHHNTYYGLEQIKGMSIQIQSLSEKVSVSLYGAMTHDEGVSALADCPNVIHLDLTATGIEGSCLSLLSSMEQLESLDLSCTFIGDDDLPLLKQFRQLRLLDLRETNLSPEAIEELKASLKECEILYEPRSTTCSFRKAGRSTPPGTGYDATWPTRAVCFSNKSAATMRQAHADFFGLNLRFR